MGNFNLQSKDDDADKKKFLFGNSAELGRRAAVDDTPSR